MVGKLSLVMKVIVLKVFAFDLLANVRRKLPN